MSASPCAHIHEPQIYERKPMTTTVGTRPSLLTETALYLRVPSDPLRPPQPFPVPEPIPTPAREPAPDGPENPDVPLPGPDPIEPSQI
jgi:hypothetical protein